jgi:hypothetical protein
VRHRQKQHHRRRLATDQAAHAAGLKLRSKGIADAIEGFREGLVSVGFGLPRQKSLNLSGASSV